ncbi:PD40 domain-containing protein [Aquimarina sp. RZ0]|uniref:TolB family protein n=1 Tax=Aquimarina sp. RZ0 TaxID=2607730 RepID=UPI00165FA8BD|nr:PD40 domain-containing protein [Aquimarina sp. RZ0]
MRKNLWGLFFFFFLNTVFSQEKRLEITSQVRKESTFVKTGEIDVNAKKESEEESGDKENLKNTEESNFLFNEPRSLEKETENFRVDILEINSKYSDYAPSFYKGELVFASSRNKGRLTTILHDLNNQPFLDLYTTKPATKGGKSVIRLKGSINTKFHESSAIFSKDGKTVYFTRNSYSNSTPVRSSKGIVLLKMYRATYHNGKWIDIEELPFNSAEYSIAHPALSLDEKFLYFASDMPGSYGESDLYMVELYKDGSFGTPQNMGSVINTSGRETFPYISDKGKLFFASDGHQGLGGLDIFMAVPTEYEKIKVYNLGAPINSSEDDFTFIINEADKKGYFASNRKGGRGDDDIYSFEQIGPLLEYRKRMPKVKKKLEQHMKFKPKKVETTSL